MSHSRSDFELVTEDEIPAFDEDFEEPPPPPPGAPDPDPKGPNRFTIWIPSEQVLVNMGAAVHRASAEQSGIPWDPSATVQVDKGYVAQTEHHIHLHTFGDLPEIQMPGPGGQTMLPALGRTILRMGSPSAVVTAVPSFGSPTQNTIKAPTEIGSVFPEPHNTWPGYAMITEGGSYRESAANNIIVSNRADLRLGGQRMVMLGSPGDVNIVSDGEMVADLMRNDPDHATELGQKDPYGTGRWVSQKPGWRVVEGISTVLTNAYGIFAAAEAIYGAKYARPPREGAAGWKGMWEGTGWLEDFATGVGLLGGFVAPVVGLALFFKGLEKRDPNDSEGNILLYASSSLTAYGETSATIHAQIATSVSSLASTSVSSTLSTSVSSALLTSMSGTMTSVSGVLSASLRSQFGSVTVHAKKTAELSAWGKVLVAGNENVQVNSMKGRVFIHGMNGFYLGAGNEETPIEEAGGKTTYAPGPGYGISGTMIGLTLGKMKDTNNFEKPDPDAKIQMLIQNDKIHLQHEKAYITLERKEIRIGGAKESRVLIG